MFDKILIQVLVLLIVSLITMLLWNWLCPLFNLPELTYCQ
jgi:hypothetical protein